MTNETTKIANDESRAYELSDAHHHPNYEFSRCVRGDKGGPRQRRSRSYDCPTADAASLKLWLDEIRVEVRLGVVVRGLNALRVSLGADE